MLTTEKKEEIDIENINYMVSVYIPPECLEGEKCPHDREITKRLVNPI